MTFDIFGFEVLAPLCIGCSVYLANEIEQLDSTLLANRIIETSSDTYGEHYITVASIYRKRYFSASVEPSKMHPLRWEIFPLSLLKKLKKVTQARIYNMYGPTEATIWCTTQNLTECENINIGRPIANTKAYVLNKVGKLQPIGFLVSFVLVVMGLR